MATKKQRRITFEKSSGNVFADIGFANPEREQLKAHLTLQIYRIIKSRGLTQIEASANSRHQAAPRFGLDALPLRRKVIASSADADCAFPRFRNSENMEVRRVI